MSNNLFLVPKNEVLATAKFSGTSATLLQNTLFLNTSRITYSNELVLGVDSNGVILYGHLLSTGFVKAYQFAMPPQDMNVSDGILINNHIFLVGASGPIHYKYSERKQKKVRFGSINIINGQVNIIQRFLPQEESSISAILEREPGELLLVYCRENRIYIDLMCIRDPYQPFKLQEFSLAYLQENFEDIHEVKLNSTFIGIKTISLPDLEGEPLDNIRIYRYNDWDNCISITTFSSPHRFWNFHFVGNSVLICAGENGLGRLLIEDGDFGSVVDSKNIVYINPWKGKVERIIEIPNDSEKVLVVVLKGLEKIYIVISIYDLTGYFNDVDSESEDIYETSFPVKEKNNFDKDYFDAMTDGQLGSYDDFNSSMDDIGDWAGE